MVLPVRVFTKLLFFTVSMFGGRSLQDLGGGWRLTSALWEEGRDVSIADLMEREGRGGVGEDLLVAVVFVDVYVCSLFWWRKCRWLWCSRSSL